MKKHVGKITIIAVFWLTVALIALVVWRAHVAQVARAEPLDTYHSSWHLVRETADEDGGDFLATYNLPINGNFASKDSSSVAAGGPFRIRAYDAGLRAEGHSPGSKWMFAICGKNYDVAADNVVDNTFSYNIVGWAQGNGMIQNLAEGAGILGTQAVIVYPGGGDALGELVSETAVTYTHGTTKFTVTNAGFTGVGVGMMAYVTGTDLTDGYYAVTAATDVNNIVMSGIAATDNNTDSTVQINPSFWADTITMDETTKWPRDGDANNIGVYNSGDNEVCFIVVETTGLEWIQFVLYDCDGAEGIQAGDLAVYGRRF